VFPTAALGVKMELQSRNQSFMRGHMEEIVSICIFDVDNCELLKVLEGFHTIAVVLLEFSPDSRLLFSCGNDDKNSYAVYDWKAGIILHNGPISGAKVNGIAWRGEEFATCGNKHVKFWSKNKGIQGKIQGNNEAMFSICCSNSVYITGSGNGNLYNWVGDVSSEPIKAHSGCKVHTLKYFSNTVYSGGDDGLVLAWKTEKNGTVK
jgi:WD40 repeat protein